MDKEVFKSARKSLGMTQSEFGEKISLTREMVGLIERGEKPITPSTVAKVKLLLAENDNNVLNESSESYNIVQKKPREVIAIGKHKPTRLTTEQYSDAFPNWKGLPMYNAPVTASFIETYRDEKIYQPQYYLRDPRFKDCSFGAIITGDSMHSEIRHGDFVICQEVVDWSFIVFGDIYYVVATNGLETCKYINADPKNDANLLLIARNERISPSPIPKDMIKRLYKVKGIVRGY